MKKHLQEYKEKLNNRVSRIVYGFKNLPVRNQKILGLGVTIIMVVTLPLFLWAILNNQKFLINQKAASGEPTTTPTPTPTESPTPTPCVRKYQTVSILNNTQSGYPGDKLLYPATITNNDSFGCGPSHFNLTGKTPGNTLWLIEFSTTDAYLDPGQSTTVSAWFTSSKNSTPGNTEIDIIATVANSNGATLASGIYQVLSPTMAPTPTATPLATPTATPIPSCNIADINKDGIVNSNDRIILISNFIFKNSSSSDLNKDGIVDSTDYSILVKNYLQSTGSCQ